MNQIVMNLLQCEKAINKLRAGLPYAFEIADVEARRVKLSTKKQSYEGPGQEVGFNRERVLQGFFFALLGEDQVHLPPKGASMSDVIIGEKPLEIKRLL